MNLVAQVVKNQQAVEEHQHAIGEEQVILGVLADVFQLPDHIVGEVADRARSEWREAFEGGGTVRP